MHILCRITTLLKLASVVLAVGLALGFWAGQRVAQASAHSPAATVATPFPSRSEMAAAKGGESNGDPHPSHRHPAGLAAGLAGLTAGAPRLAPRKLLPPPRAAGPERGRA